MTLTTVQWVGRIAVLAMNQTDHAMELSSRLCKFLVYHANVQEPPNVLPAFHALQEQAHVVPQELRTLTRFG